MGGRDSFLLLSCEPPNSMVKISIVRDKDGFDLGVRSPLKKKFQSLDRIELRRLCVLAIVIRQHWALPQDF